MTVAIKLTHHGILGMKYRKLRIAWSVGWGLLAVLLVLLWLHGYWRTHSIKLRKPPLACAIWSGRGALALSFSDHFRVNNPERLAYESYRVGPNRTTLLGFDYQHGSSISWTIFVPNWFTMGVLATIAAMPWMRWRFSLRTLLIAITLAAVGLGALIFAAK